MKFESYLTTKNIILWILLIIILVWFFLNIYKFKKIKEAKTWNITNAEIINFDIMIFGKKNIFINYKDLSQYLNPEYEYLPQIQYRYEINGSEFTSTIINYGTIYYYNSDSIQKLVDDLIESQLIIHYNPNKLAQSYIYLPNEKYLYRKTLLNIIILLIILGIIISYDYNLHKKIINHM